MKELIIGMVVIFILLSTVFAQHEYRRKWGIPTYTIEIRKLEKSNPTNFSMSGSYEMPDGMVVGVEKKRAGFPSNFYVNADCYVDLFFYSDDGDFEIKVFYEYRETSEVLFSLASNKDHNAKISLKPHKE